MQLSAQKVTRTSLLGLMKHWFSSKIEPNTSAEIDRRSIKIKSIAANDKNAITSAKTCWAHSIRFCFHKLIPTKYEYERAYTSPHNDTTSRNAIAIW